MANVKVNDLRPGMTLCEDIYNQDRLLLLPKDTVFTDEGIALIKNLGFTQINAQLPLDEPEPTVRRILSNARIKEFQSAYATTKNNFTDMIKHIGAGNRIDTNQAYGVIAEVTEKTGPASNIFTYLNQIGHLDDHTIGHSINVAMICGIICQWVELDPNMAKEVMVAGLLHDIGKSAIPQEILDKPGPLTASEWEKVKKHTVYGYQMLKEAGMPSIVQQGALSHHEREDGSGYPLKARHIPFAVKIITLADIYDAMTTTRSYRGKMCSFKVMKDLQYDYFGVLDTGLLMTFLHRIGECYLGETVSLNDGTVGEVVYIDPLEPTRPLVKTEQGVLNLKELKDVEIESIIQHSEG